MDLGHPYRTISHPLDGAVLTVLAGTTRPLTGGEVARLAPEGSHPGVWKALGRLAELGVVDRRDAGNASLYALNREHLATPAVEHLTSLRGSLLSRLRETIGAWTIAPLHVSMFGSAARGDGDARSDIDMLVVRFDDVAGDDLRWREQLDGLAESARRWTGNHVALSELSEARLAALAQDPAPIVDSLRRDAITLHGEDADMLLRERP